VPPVAVRLAGDARLISNVVDPVWVMVPAVPVMVSERAKGTALVVVFIVSVEVPLPPAIDAGLKPPLVTPVGKPFSLLTLKLTVPVNPLFGITVTVKVADWPGRIACAEGPAIMSKSGLVGSTVIVRVGGLGSELPLESITVSELT
jgi:hypothetical protein